MRNKTKKSAIEKIGKIREGTRKTSAIEIERNKEKKKL
jgi:hypothetical protein